MWHLLGGCGSLSDGRAATNLSPLVATQNTRQWFSSHYICLRLWGNGDSSGIDATCEKCGKSCSSHLSIKIDKCKTYLYSLSFEHNLNIYVLIIVMYLSATLCLYGNCGALCSYIGYGCSSIIFSPKITYCAPEIVFALHRHILTICSDSCCAAELFCTVSFNATIKKCSRYVSGIFSHGLPWNFVQTFVLPGG